MMENISRDLLTFHGEEVFFTCLSTSLRECLLNDQAENANGIHPIPQTVYKLIKSFLRIFNR
ncbi:hypothetical protein SRABI134_00258 [Peribacillus sp. Bi134]|nr:hypothetical protein SRABI134_00258 [Peribacillus sp. Bi134]